MLCRRTLNLPQLFLYRYIRTMPVVGILILMNIALNNLKLYQAPYYFPDQQVKGCKDHWWTTLALIQNYYHANVKEMVMNWY
jgi:hypothetical protein